jgi:7-keto-8-aminopelargonate synthetase-like enzyme
LRGRRGLVGWAWVGAGVWGDRGADIVRYVGIRDAREQILTGCLAEGFGDRKIQHVDAAAAAGRARRSCF